jgi:hypothetical protein
MYTRTWQMGNAVREQSIHEFSFEAIHHEGTMSLDGVYVRFLASMRVCRSQLSRVTPSRMHALLPKCPRCAQSALANMRAAGLLAGNTCPVRKERGKVISIVSMS